MGKISRRFAKIFKKDKTECQIREVVKPEHDTKRLHKTNLNCDIQESCGIIWINFRQSALLLRKGKPKITTGYYDKGKLITGEELKNDGLF